MGNITERAAYHLKFNDRFMRIYAALGIDYLERTLITTILNDPGPWGIRALASYMGVNRSTLYRRLLEREVQGVCCRIGGKWTCTEFGRAGSIALMNEIADVATGNQRFLSDEIISLCATLNPTLDVEHARTITFKRNSFYGQT